jgi:hypothetical protein
MATQCEHCGSSNIYHRIIDQGTSPDLYRCAHCQFDKNFPNVPNTTEMQRARKIATSTGAALILPIDQSNNAQIQEHATGNLKEAASGICAIMTAYWVGGHFKHRNAADEAFAERLNTGIRDMIVQQAVYMSETSSRQKLSEQAEKARQAYFKLTGSYEGPDTLRPVMRGEYIDLGVQEQRQEAWKEAMELRSAVKDAYQLEIDRFSLNTKSGTEPVQNAPLAELPQTMGAQPAGLYVINLNAPGALHRRLWTGNLGGVGHVIGVQISELRFRFMDANTGLWACDSHAMLVDVIRAHMTEFYNSMFGGGSYTLWRF